ncbi:MAG: hypothetical protein PHI89_04100 [Thiovulaceae bacterium]|nr:hypothetical protein [Sulfurimonadaceae bacterium]
MNKKMISVILIALITVLSTGCSTNTHYISQVPKDVSFKNDESVENYRSKDFATITCSEGETERAGLFGIGWSTPTLRLTFENNPIPNSSLDMFNTFYEAVRVAPGTRNFRLKYEFRGMYSNINVRNFKFEPDTNYFAYFSRSGNIISVWIEKEDGSIVFGKKPGEGRFY